MESDSIFSDRSRSRLKFVYSAALLRKKECDFGQKDAGRSGKCRIAGEKPSFGDAELAGEQRTDNELSEDIWLTAKERELEP